MENHALKPEPTYKSVNCTTCYYNILSVRHILTVCPHRFTLCAVSDADGYRPACLRSTQLDVDDRRAVDNALTLEQWPLVAEMSMIAEPWIMHLR